MATDWKATRNQIIGSALRKISSNDSMDSIPGEEIDDAAFQLNALIKEWMARGIDLWVRREITLFLASGTEKYSLGNTNMTESYTETALRVAASDTDTTMEVDSTTGLTDGDFCGVKQDDGTIHWTTATLTDGDTLELAAGLTDDAAVDNAVYFFTTKSERPQKILYAYRRDSSDIDTPVEIISREEYSRLGQKGASGPVNQIHHDPQMTYGNLFVWPAVNTDIDKLILVAQDIVSNMDTSSSNPEFPSEWHNALVWNLALELAPEYDYEKRNPRGLKFISYMAKEKFETLLDYDVGEASISFAFGNRAWQ